IPGPFRPRTRVEVGGGRISQGAGELPPVVYGSLTAYLAEERADGPTKELKHPFRGPDAETTACPDVHPRLQQHSRLPPDHAGAGRRIRRVESDRLRAHWRAPAKGLSEAFAPQGSLFAT